MAKTSKVKGFEFGAAFEELNQIVQKLEAGEVDLDQALKLYEQGLKVVQSCKTHLQQVENRVRVIRETYASDGAEADQKEDSATPDQE